MPAEAPTGWSSRRPTPPPPASATEIIALSTASGTSLAVEVRCPPRARATAILLHSSMASRRTWGPAKDDGFAAVLAEHGVRSLSLDFRGHGESGVPAARGGNWTFDDLVRHDLPALCRAARERWPRERLTLVGHSLGGQVALAALATEVAEADAIAVIATNVWLPSEEPNLFLRAKKAAVMRGMRSITRARGSFPARALRLGSDDEAAAYMAGWTSNWDRDRWMNDDCTVDYFDAMGRLRCPILAITSFADQLLCTPSCAFRFIGRASRANVRFEMIRRSDQAGAPLPDHMGIVTTRRAVSSWHDVADFCVG
jgi:predicted alpha/beta hydrolase